MLLISFILSLLSLLTITSASKIIFSKINEKIYVETDERHYAMYGQIKLDDEIRVIAVNGPTQYYQTSKTCDTGRAKFTRDYSSIRHAYLNVYNKAPKISKVTTKCYTWSEDFESGEPKKYSAVRLDDDTVVYSSNSLPSGLSRMIISGDLVTFVHYDGRVVLKTKDCLYHNEKILHDGICKTNGRRLGLFSLKGDETIRRHLIANSFNQVKFNLEQEYYKTYTKEELQARGDAILQEAIKPTKNQ